MACASRTSSEGPADRRRRDRARAPTRRGRPRARVRPDCPGRASRAHPGEARCRRWRIHRRRSPLPRRWVRRRARRRADRHAPTRRSRANGASQGRAESRREVATPAGATRALGERQGSPGLQVRSVRSFLRSRVRRSPGAVRNARQGARRLPRPSNARRSPGAAFRRRRATTPCSAGCELGVGALRSSCRSSGCSGSRRRRPAWSDHHLRRCSYPSRSVPRRGS